MRSAQKGFTLVELLVVITIIAVLSVVGITVYGNIQTRARDARRTVEIDSVAKAMEINYGRFVANSYSRFCQITAGPTYDCSQWFSGTAVPQDPHSPKRIYHWCDPTETVNNPVCASAGNGLGNNAPDGRADWMVCASLEAGGKYCKKNQQ